MDKRRVRVNERCIYEEEEKKKKGVQREDWREIEAYRRVFCVVNGEDCWNDIPREKNWLFASRPVLFSVNSLLLLCYLRLYMRLLLLTSRLLASHVIALISSVQSNRIKSRPAPSKRATISLVLKFVLITIKHDNHHRSWHDQMKLRMTMSIIVL